jgi:hypothetical protein
METRQLQTTGAGPMSQYEARISPTPDNDFYALVVRIDPDGQENVIHGYKGRHFATRTGAERSTSNYIAKIS